MESEQIQKEMDQFWMDQVEKCKNIKIPVKFQKSSVNYGSIGKMKLQEPEQKFVPKVKVYDKKSKKSLF
jgi:hypothetical protein